MEPRLTFEELRDWICRCYFHLCTYRLKSEKTFYKKRILLFHNISANDEGVFERPIERIMYQTVLLILASDCEPNELELFWKHLELELADHDLDTLLSDIPEDEAKIFVSHLNTLLENKPANA